jgi:protein SCO1/2
VVTHVIDKGGQFAAKFRGLKFGLINLILYVSGLIDNEAISDGHAENHHEMGFWDRMIFF